MYGRMVYPGRLRWPCKFLDVPQPPGRCLFLKPLSRYLATLEGTQVFGCTYRPDHLGLLGKYLSAILILTRNSLGQVYCVYGVVCTWVSSDRMSLVGFHRPWCFLSLVPRSRNLFSSFGTLSTFCPALSACLPVCLSAVRVPRLSACICWYMLRYA